ncbi:Phage minor capsid protein [Streptococcus gallolyticus]|uniref:Phage minor capsid protein n=1 Tax=Streptococcus gallolyticus TaxID=315405 RepID=A0A139MVB4_9STRE|nr:putative minor capsid protein [Streptococcus gallolyticus]KXT67673.1 Phage minor capsid protein [Streptococcus gallolyticus]QBX25001.1 minor capsid protein [Streptococcus phage Javan224]
MIDKRLLQDTISVRKVQDTDDFGDLTYSEPLTIQSVRFDRGVSVKGTNNSKTKDKTGTVFIYPAVSKVDVDDSWLEATINDGNRDYIVKSIQPNYLNGKLFSYEIGVV